MFRPFTLFATTMLVAPAALAETPSDPVVAAPVQPSATVDADTPQSAGAPANPVHGEQATDIIITAPFVRELDVLANKSVLTGDRLVQDLRPTIGETLTRLPGVSATSFGPGSSRPVLRGFQGERVRVLTDGLGSLDVSNTSVDHGVAIDPLTAERVEVLRGPAVLLFGSQAIGGAVNVIDRRIPRVVPEQGFHVDAIGTYGSAADERGIGGAFDVAVTPNIVVHADGSYRRSDDQEVGGFVLSSGLRAEQRNLAAEAVAEGNADEAAEAIALAGLRGAIPNSATETYTLGGGIALINDRGSLGFSAGYYDTDYGISERPGAEHAHAEGETDSDAEEGPVTIALKQFRADMRGEIQVDGGFIERIRARVGYADYEHTEFEGAEVGTRFLTDAFEGRIELVQSGVGSWRGVTGVQGFTRDFLAVGAEAFVPPNQTDQFGLFTVQELDFDKLSIEIAARYEHADVRSNAVRIGFDDAASTTAVDRGFDSFSGALGVTWQATGDLKLGLTGSRAARAPSAEELFSNGPHVATQAFEVGDPGFTTEKSWGLEAFASGKLGPVQFKLNGYATWFEDFIYEFDTGLEQDELPLFQYAQADARYYGFEAEVNAVLVKTDGFSLKGDLIGDYVNARLTDGGGPVPRIPPLRLLGGIEGAAGAFGGRIEVEHVFEQDRVATFESPTDDFTLVNASLSWHPFGDASETTLIVSANNIFDVDARRHASFTKDFVPLPGRDIRVAARFSF